MCFLFQVFVPDPSRNATYLKKNQEGPKDSGLLRSDVYYILQRELTALFRAFFLEGNP